MKLERLFDIPYYQLKKYNTQKAFNMKSQGKWESLSCENYLRDVNRLSKGLLALGVQPNDKIAVITSNNRTEWNILDLAVLQIGAQNVPIYSNITSKDYVYILNHSESAYCFVSDKEILQKINAIKSKTKLKDVFTFDKILGEKHWLEITFKSEDAQFLERELSLRKSNVKNEDLATIIYTSGTTGKPKGVMISHKNLLSTVVNSSVRMPYKSLISRSLSFLPVCHIYERMMLYLYQYLGIGIYFAESMETIGDNLKEVKPHLMTGVPRLYEKIYDKIYAKGATLKGIKRILFFWAIALGFRYQLERKNGFWYALQLSLARMLIFSKWKKIFGGELKILNSGGAPLQERLVRIFTAARMPLLEGYGLTETSPTISVNTTIKGQVRFGTVGTILPQVKVKIAEDGEILVKGPNVMLGYYKEPEKTAEVFKDGYFCTGDIGTLSEDNYLKITDRKKEIFKTSGGKYVAPSILENKLKQSRFIEQAMVIGEGQKMPAALIQPHFEFLKNWMQIKNIKHLKSLKEICNDAIVIKRFAKEIEICNENFAQWEKIKDFRLTSEIWSVDLGLLTPTLKMKRLSILKHYENLYKDIYDI